MQFVRSAFGFAPAPRLRSGQRGGGRGSGPRRASRHRLLAGLPPGIRRSLLAPKNRRSPSTVNSTVKTTRPTVFLAGPNRPPPRQKAAKFKHFPPFSKLFHVEQLAVPRIPRPKPPSAPKTTPQTQPTPPLTKFTVNTVRTVKGKEQKRMHLQSRDLQGTCSVAVSQY